MLEIHVHISDDRHSVLLEKLFQIERTLNSMATKADLDAGLTNLESVVSTLGTDLAAALKDLTDKINAGGTGEDLQPELDRINAVATNLSSLDTSAKSADPGPQTPTA